LATQGRRNQEAAGAPDAFQKNRALVLSGAKANRIGPEEPSKPNGEAGRAS